MYKPYCRIELMWTATLPTPTKVLVKPYVWRKCIDPKLRQFGFLCCLGGWACPEPLLLHLLLIPVGLVTSLYQHTFWCKYIRLYIFTFRAKKVDENTNLVSQQVQESLLSSSSGLLWLCTEPLCSSLAPPICTARGWRERQRSNQSIWLLISSSGKRLAGGLQLMAKMRGNHPCYSYSGFPSEQKAGWFPFAK